MAVPIITLEDGRQFKLGRIRPKARPKVLRFACYLDESKANPPQSVDYTPKAAAAIAQVYGNDQYGDCVIAGKMHAIGIATGNELGVPAVGTAQEAVDQYHRICGGGDNGCVITSVLDYVQSNGLIVGGKVHKIVGYVAVDWTNKLEVQTAIYIFGTLTIGIALPSAWMNSEIWDVTSSQIIGGHDVTVAAYDEKYVWVLTWGGIRKMTWAAFLSKNYVDECYLPLYEDWAIKDGVAVNGIAIATLEDDLVKIGNGTIPPIDPVDPPWSWSDWG